MSAATVSTHDVRAMAGALLTAMRSMTSNQREQLPMKEFGERYNCLLELAKEVVPNIDPRRWPKPVTFAPYGQADRIMTSARFVELEAYIREIEAVVPQDFSM